MHFLKIGVKFTCRTRGIKNNFFNSNDVILITNEIIMRYVLIIVILGLAACGKENDLPDSGMLTLEFQHVVNGAEAAYDEMIYENEAGNVYELTNIQYFVSDVILVRQNGDEITVDGVDWIHYIDSDLPQTWNWPLTQEFTSGDFSAIKFTFGIKGEKNLPDRFTDSPESNMFWPYPMGGDQGGYHYMKLNGFWNDPENERTPFNFHLGVGQIYDNEGNVTSYVQNWFETEIPVAFSIMPAETTRANVRMNIENWFKNPHIYDHNEFGSRIMNNQDAMGKISDNGRDVFSISVMADEKI
jgi:hypothetical protein